LVTLSGTAPYLVASNALIAAGKEGFHIFDFTPIGLPVLIVGTLFVAFVGRHLLPKDIPESFREARREAGPALRFAHALEERRFRLRITEGSPFAGKAIADTELGSILGLHVYAVRRGSQTIPVVTGDFVFAAGDILFVQGRVEEFQEFLRWQAFEMASGAEIVEVLASQQLALVTAIVGPQADLIGRTVEETDFARRFGAHILSIRREDEIYRRDFSKFQFRAGDRLQIETKKDGPRKLEDSKQFASVEVIARESVGLIYPDSESLLELNIPADSRLVGLTIAKAGLNETLGLRIIGIARRGGSVLFPLSEEVLKAGDKLLVHGPRARIELMRGIQALELMEPAGEDQLISQKDTGFIEATLSPRSTLAGKSIKDLNFRQRYGVQVLSIWRGGRSYRSHLRNMTLEFGDALLLQGPRQRVEELSKDPDFLILSHVAQEGPTRKNPWRTLLAAALMIAVVVMALMGMNIAVASIVGATLMILTRCLNMEEAYRSIDWKSVFLVACMIPLGTAMQNTHATEWIAEGITGVLRPFGAWGILIGLYLLTMLATAVVPTAALVVIMSAIGIKAADAFGIPPQTMVMCIAMAASTSVVSPIAHSANVLVMGPGGYNFMDYVKMGFLLALVVMITVLPLAAWRW